MFTGQFETPVVGSATGGEIPGSGGHAAGGSVDRNVLAVGHAIQCRRSCERNIVINHKVTKTQGFSALLCVFVSLWLMPSACNKSSTTAKKAEVTEVRIPRGAGGVGFLPLLVMEKYRIIEQRAREAGIPQLRVNWIDLGG